MDIYTHTHTHRYDRFFCAHNINPHLLYSAGTQLLLTCVRVNGGIWEVEGGLVIALLKCFPTYHFVRSTIAPEADCHPA